MFVNFWGCHVLGKILLMWPLLLSCHFVTHGIMIPKITCNDTCSTEILKGGQIIMTWPEL